MFVCWGDQSVREMSVGSSAFIHACRNDWANAPCSYRGPDLWLLNQLNSGKAPEGKDAPFIACDANGENGDEPHHDDGLCVLWSSGKTEFIRWEEMEGYDGGPVKVGPGSPDPRLRHLVR